MNTQDKAQTAAKTPSKATAAKPRTKQEIEDRISRVDPVPLDITATHEAGHIAAAVILGHEVTYASIVANYDELLWGTVATRISDIDRLAGLVTTTPAALPADPNWRRLARRRLVQILAGAAANRVAGHVLTSGNLAQDYGHAHQLARLLIAPGQDTKPVVEHFTLVAERVVRSWWPLVEAARDALLRAGTLEGDRLTDFIRKLQTERNLMLFQKRLEDIRFDREIHDADVPHVPSEPTARVAPNAPGRLARRNTGNPRAVLPPHPKSLLDLDTDAEPGKQDGEPQIG